jgi:hypothetical protein
MLSRNCQCVSQFRLLWQSEHPTPCSHRGQPNQARRPRSAVGSIGNTASHPIRKHSSGHQVVVDTLLIVVKIGVQHRVRAILLGEHFHGGPVVPDRLDDGGPAARLVEGQVVCERQMIRLNSSFRFSLCRHVERATRVRRRARGRQWPPSHSAVELDHSFSTSQAVRRADIVERAFGGLVHGAIASAHSGWIDGILTGLHPSRRLGCRTVRMGLRCQGSGIRR